MTHEQEQLLKKVLREHECPLCLKQMMDKYPKMLDCIFRHNNDEHLCKRAEKYMEGIGMKAPLYKKVKIRCSRCGETRTYEIDVNDNGPRGLANQLVGMGFSLFGSYKKVEIYCPQCRNHAHKCHMDYFSETVKKQMYEAEVKEMTKYIKEVAE